MADNQITKWEYKYVSQNETELNKAGEQGWEAMDTGTDNSTKILMKRPKITQTQQKAPEPYPSYSR